MSAETPLPRFAADRTSMNRRMTLTVRCALVAVLSGLAVMPQMASAAENGTWSLTPAAQNNGNVPRDFIFLEAQPGQNIPDSVVIENKTNAKKSFTMYGADAFNSPTGGGFALTTIEDDAKDLGTWISFPRGERYEVGPTSSVRVPVVFRVPKNTTPGDHVGGVVALDDAVTAPAPGQQLAVQTKQALGVRVYARVAGPVTPLLSVQNFTADASGKPLPIVAGGTTDVSFLVTNTGNVRLAPTAQVVLTTWFGREVGRSPAQELTEILPGQSVKFDAAIEGSSFVGPVYARLNLVSPDAVAGADATDWVIPWGWIIALLVILVLAIVVRVLRRGGSGRRRDAGAMTSSSEVAEEVTQ